VGGEKKKGERLLLSAKGRVPQRTGEKGKTPTCNGKRGGEVFPESWVPKNQQAKKKNLTRAKKGKTELKRG